ncbi:hypothetical protein DH2020_003974 [Rehmannia glutinosa]|uniref:SWIM-type domain-containing protein n=1 Tax=Rehmannia glutinosa TaxID=99300 RepID=A0ABR0XN40_REHGL
MRPVVVVDGTFLIERYKGVDYHYLSRCKYAIYPLAWAVVDSENDASWHWFFMNLKGFTGNLRIRIKKDRYYLLFNKAAEAYTIEEFHKYMSQIQAIDEKGWKYLNDTNFATWARSYFQGDRYNIMTSNNAESLNSVFKKARQTPILALFDSIGKSCDLGSMRGVRPHGCTGNLTPAMEEKLRKSHEKAKKFTVEPIDQSLYVVRSGATNFTVNFAENTCTCRKFQLDHLPREHAIATPRREVFQYTPCAHRLIPLTIGGKHIGDYLPVPNENEWEIPDNIKEMIVLPPIVDNEVGVVNKDEYRQQKVPLKTKMR